MDDLSQTNQTWSKFDETLLAIVCLPPWAQEELRARLEERGWFEIGLPTSE